MRNVLAVVNFDLRAVHMRCAAKLFYNSSRTIFSALNRSFLLRNCDILHRKENMTPRIIKERTNLSVYMISFMIFILRLRTFLLFIPGYSVRVMSKIGSRV